jgi:hypothetical protein
MRQKTHLVREAFTLTELANYARDCKSDYCPAARATERTDPTQTLDNLLGSVLMSSTTYDVASILFSGLVATALPYRSQADSRAGETEELAPIETVGTPS